MSYHFKDVSVVVVEGPGPHAGVLKARLEALDFHDISVTDSGEKALADARTPSCNLLFCDWEVADMDGLTFLRRLREDAKMEFVNVVLVDREADPERLEAAAEAGVNNYIAHPFDGLALRRKIEALLGKPFRS